RWLSTVRTENQNRLAYQNLSYEFDAVGNVLSYTNTSDGHTTTQNYSYDGLYQLIQAQGSSRSHPYGPQGATEYTTTYKQDFTFNRIGNMTNKISESMVSTPNRLGDNLNYNLDYDYVQGTRKASRIGNRHYSYDLNGNLIAERDGSNAVNPEVYRPYYQDGDLYWTDYGFGVTRPQTQNSSDGVYQRNYRWNERNLLSESSDSAYTVQYRYGADGQRAVKYVLNNRRSTLYFNRMWQTNDSRAEWVQSKHIYLGEQRILTKYNSEGNNNTQAERERIYYYHSDHLGSAQTITNHIGQLHERIEYTPYGELWIDWKNLNSPGDGTPFRFTGKELDEETGLYYYGARYLDPRISRWLSVDPAMYEGDYLPSAPINDEARQRNQNLPGIGGIYNYVNFHVYHYGGNNPVKFVDPDGRNQVYLILISPDEELYSYLENLLILPIGILDKVDRENLFVVAAHGNSDYIKDQNGNNLNPNELASLIRQHEKYRKGQSILLLSCSAGGIPSNYFFNFAQRLSDVLSTDVFAPNKILWSIITSTLLPPTPADPYYYNFTRYNGEVHRILYIFNGTMFPDENSLGYYNLFNHNSRYNGFYNRNGN
ncbi:MAG: hypothetical protein FWD47_15085, partial [Treponema sp.]|nr:hypothetical protein [Treponema sp.]